MKQTKTLASGFPVMLEDERAKYMAREVKYEETIESLRQQLAEKDAEIEHMRGVSECHAIDLRERDAAIKSHAAKSRELEKQLAASQLQNTQLREVLEWVVDIFTDNTLSHERDPELWVGGAKEALAIPADTTALEAMIAKAGEVMRERCSAECWKRSTEPQLIAAQQRMAEACAKVCDKSAHEWRGANSRQIELANAIRNGDWREYL